MSNITDHYSVFNVIEVEEAIVESAYIEINKRMLKDENMSILSERIRSYEWKNIERLNNVEEAYKEFNDNLKLMFDESCPNKTIKIKKLDIKKPYITSEIKRLIRDKHRLQRLYNKKPITHGIEYRKLRNKLNKIIRNAKSNYFKSKLENNTNNMKQSWGVISNLLGNDSKAQLPDSFCIDGAIVDDPVVIANAFNNYFSNIGSNIGDRFEQNEEYRQYL